MENKKQFSLITTLFNEEQSILNFLESYRNQSKYADEFIIVDGGSSDKTVSIIEAFSDSYPQLNITILIDKDNSKIGAIARGRNRAIHHTVYEYIAVTDAGVILGKEWFKEIIKPFEDEEVDVVSGWYEANIQNKFQQFYSDVYLPKLESLDLEKFLPSSRSIAFKKSCWLNVGKYPIKTLTAEDTLFDLNLKESGCKFHFSSKAIVYWNCPSSYMELLEKANYYAIGDGQHKLHLKAFLLRNILLLFPLNLLFSKQKRKHFRVIYGTMFAYQKGYVKGFFA